MRNLIGIVCLIAVFFLSSFTDGEEDLGLSDVGYFGNGLNIAARYSHEGNHSLEIQALERTKRAIETYSSKETKYWIEVAQWLSADYDLYVGDYEASITLEKEIIAILNKMYGSESPEVADGIRRLIGTLISAHHNDEAIAMCDSVLSVNLNKEIGHAKLYNYLGLAYGNKGMKEDAIVNYQHALELCDDEHFQSIIRQNLQSELGEEKNVAKLEWIYKQLPKTASKSDKFFALQNIALIYSNEGNHKKAYDYYLKAQSFVEPTLNPIPTIRYFHNMSVSAPTRYLKLKYLKEALAIYDKTGIKDRILRGNIYKALADDYSENLDYGTADDYYTTALLCYEDGLDAFNSSLLSLFNNAARNRASMQDYSHSIKLQKLACMGSAVTHGKGSEVYNVYLSNLFTDYLHADSIAEAETVLKEYEISTFHSKKDYTYQLSLLYGLLRLKQKDYTNANALFLHALRSADNINSQLNILGYLCEIATATGDTENFIRYKKQELSFHRSNLILHLYEMSREERNNLEVYLNNVRNDAISSIKISTAIAPDTYDFILFSKGLQFHTEQEVEKVLKKKGLRTESYKSYVELKKQLSQALSAGDSITVRRLSDHVSSLERELTNEFVEIESLRKNLDITTKKVLSKLGGNSIGIDFIRYENDAKPTYGAFVISSKIRKPIFLKLFSEGELLELINLPNNQFYRDKTTRDRTRKLIWGKLEPYFVSYTDIYFAPDGMLHTLGIEYLLDNNATPINQQFRLHRVFHLADISKNEFLGKSLVAVGVSDYNTPISDDNVADRGSFNDLPGVRTEFTTLRHTISAVSNPVDTTMYYNDLAREVNFKMLSTQGVTGLHIATHGFFRDKKSLERSAEIEEDVDHNIALRTLRSGQESLAGLVLRGGNLSWQCNNLDETEDDILTSHEVETLDFPNLRLTILSACETGLGDINSDGVWGLQRSFRIAGTRNLICSLRRVNDKATARFMEIFYKNALNGKSIYDAFRLAQQTIFHENKRRPEVWASFILIE